MIQSKNTESMSLPLSVMSTLTTSSWVVYGVIIKDVYVQVGMHCKLFSYEVVHNVMHIIVM